MPPLHSLSDLHSFNNRLPPDCMDILADNELLRKRRPPHRGSGRLSGGPGRWMWADGQSVSFSRLSGETLLGSDCVLVENPRSWISTSCSPETQHPFICSSQDRTH
ncbi:hypothetical protein KUCAC02_023157 [Chaenocephalus aceratus]|uniref:Uncharacterized protein n=1 Tax=Chaenocephalus aceratus TaxID=36190 RepID=A0ACB9XP85_CHAAC|nr:hypothetical protein KUCAC02_023157 [Chaenocephalus aceratus]